MSSLGSDPRLIVAHWADEATRAAATDTPEARENRDQDMQAAIARGDAERAPRRNVLRRILGRFRHTPR
jgi:hypothetical protein